MIQLIKKILFTIRVVLSFPVFIAVLLSKNKELIYQEMRDWKKNLYIDVYNSNYILFCTLFVYRDYRSCLYTRLGRVSYLFSWLFKGREMFYNFMPSDKIGKGFIVHHPIATRINCRGIGENCMVWQMVTIGKGKAEKGLGTTPIIGNNVKICANSTVVGGITIGNNVTIAAGSVVVKSVPDNCLVAGNPAKIIKRDGVKVNEPL